MSEGHPADGDWANIAVDELRRRLVASSTQTKDAVLEEWTREHADPQRPDSEAHLALSIKELLREFRTENPLPGKARLVLILHGIRDHGAWMEMIKHRLSGEHVVVKPLDYEFYDSLRFMIGIGASSIVEGIKTKLRDAQADHPNHELTIIAHSFGTHITTKILLDCPEIRCKKLILCGAVVSRKFPFRKLTQRPIVINECGDRDIWPVLAQGFNLRFTGRYGAAGVFGIRDPSVEDRFHDFKHSDYLKPEFVDKYWKPFIENDLTVESEYQANRREIPWGVSILSKGWSALIFAVLCLGAMLGVAWIIYSWSYIKLAVGISMLCLLSYAFVLWRIVNDARRFHSPLSSIATKP